MDINFNKVSKIIDKSWNIACKTDKPIQRYYSQSQMKQIRLPKNKFARLGINIFIIVFWFYLSIALFGGIAASSMFGIKYVEDDY